MSDSVVSAVPSPSSGGGGFLPKATLIHVACEALIIGVVFFLLNRKIAAQQSDLIECAVRIASQNKRISELEDSVKELSLKMSSLSSSLTSLASKQVAAAAPSPSRMPMHAFPPSFPIFSSSSAPLPTRPDTPVPDTPSAASIHVDQPFRSQPFLDNIFEQQQPFLAPAVSSPVPIESSSVAAPAATTTPGAPAEDPLDREIAAELKELGQ